jgi:hypothetical protein
VEKAVVGVARAITAPVEKTANELEKAAAGHAWRERKAASREA